MARHEASNRLMSNPSMKSRPIESSLDPVYIHCFTVGKQSQVRGTYHLCIGLPKCACSYCTRVRKEHRVISILLSKIWHIYHHVRRKSVVFWHQFLSVIISDYLEHSWNRLEYCNSISVLKNKKTLTESSCCLTMAISCHIWWDRC